MKKILDECMHPLKTGRRRLTDSLADLITIDDEITIDNVRHCPARCVTTYAS